MKAGPVTEVERSQNEPLGLEARLGAHGGRVYATDRCGETGELAIFLQKREVVDE
jgi:hypothetical protein